MSLIAMSPRNKVRWVIMECLRVNAMQTIEVTARNDVRCIFAEWLRDLICLGMCRNASGM